MHKNIFYNFRRQTHRLKGFDYSSNGYYYITICTKNREHYFGEIIGDVMQYSLIGKIAQRYWSNILRHYPFIKLDEFIVMPNHIHGVLIINHGLNCKVATQYIASLQFTPQTLGHYNKFAPQSGNLSAIIRGFKIGVKKYAVIQGLDFQWQPRFYDKIIRNDNELFRIREYIRNNPVGWREDRNNL
ncbi:MAG: transposase [Candidatus Komeilibacteria bacterium]|nr:transposase [Candidatus Komeilibacteria bacterium]